MKTTDSPKLSLDTLEKRLNKFYSKIQEYKTLYTQTEKKIDKLKSRPMSVEEYQNEGYCCPICHSQDTFQIDIFTSGGDIAQVVKQCETCGTQWEERYNFADIHIYDDMDKKAHKLSNTSINTLVGSDGDVVDARYESNGGNDEPKNIPKTDNILKGIDKSLTEVFLHWCTETNNNVSSWRDFLKCYEGTYISVEKFAENIIEQRMWFGDLKLPKYILDSLDYTKVWKKLENEYSAYIENDVHITRKNL